MYDHDIAVAIRKDMESLVAQSREVTDKYRRGNSSYMKLSQMFLRLFAELM